MKAFLLAIGLLSACYGDFDVLQFDYECNVVGAGTMNKQLFFKGKSGDAFKCAALVPAEEFFAKYESCSIGEGASCSFGYWHGNLRKDVISFLKNNDETYCNFICTLKK